jgi:hypothetical protein
MSNDIMKIENKPAYMQKTDLRVTDEFEGGLAAGLALPFLSIRGKEFRVRKDGNEVALNVRNLPLVLVAARSTISKRYYAGVYSSDAAGALPDCWSDDGITPAVPNPVSPTCIGCPKNAWGSRITPAGKQAKECQDIKRLIVALKPGDKYQALVLDVPATSLKAPRGQRVDGMLFREYLETLKRHGVQPIECETVVTFTSAEYPQLSFAFSRYLSEDEWRQVLALREDPDVLEALGNSKPAEASPTLPPKPEYMKPEEAPKAETPKAETPKAETPKAETPKAETPKNDADVLAEVMKLLNEG